jgi:uncharacterized membrane protein YgcG
MATDLHSPPPLPRRPAGGPGISVRTTIVVLLAAFAVLVGVGALIAGPISTPSKVSAIPTKPAAQVQLEATSSAGENPFMEPVGQDQTVATPVAAGGQFASDTPGLFGDSGNQNSCDAKTMISNLRADPRRATAWAGAVGITSDKIADFVGTLTPVVLRSDTSVTSYGYADGAFTGYPAVLQAGTAVFVDSYGAPAVKCFSGNPLAAPSEVRNAGYVGNAWRSFQPAAVTVIQPVTTVISDYTFIDVHRGSRVHCSGKAWWPHRHHPDWNRDWDHDRDHDWDKRPSCPDYRGPGTDKCRPSDTGVDGKPHPGKDGGKDGDKDGGKDGGKPNGGNGGNGNGGGGTAGGGTAGGGTAGGGTPGSGAPGNEAPGNGTAGNGAPGNGTPGTGNPPRAGGAGTGATPGTPGAGTLPAGGGNQGTGDVGKGGNKDGNKDGNKGDNKDGGQGGVGQGGAPAAGGIQGGKGGSAVPVGGGPVGSGHGPVKQGETTREHQPAPILTGQGNQHPKSGTGGKPQVDGGQILVKDGGHKSDGGHRSDRHESDKHDSGSDSGSGSKKDN